MQKKRGGGQRLLGNVGCCCWSDGQLVTVASGKEMKGEKEYVSDVKGMDET